MPIFRITSEKYMALFNEYWTNVYYGTGSSTGDFGAEITAIVNAEKALMWADVKITKVRVDDMVPGSDNSRTYVQNVACTRVSTASDAFPLWVTARVDFETNGGGRPSRKYIRGMLREEDGSWTGLAAGAKSLLQTYANAIIAAAAIVDVDGQEFTAGSPFDGLQMRQLRRGSKKRSPHNPMGKHWAILAAA